MLRWFGWVCAVLGVVLGYECVGVWVGVLLAVGGWDGMG